MAKWNFRGTKGTTFTKITSSTVETEIIPAYEGTLTNLYALIITNTSGSACKVTIKDEFDGQIKSVYQVPATDTRGFIVHPEGALEQNYVNKQWTAICGSSVDSIEITALFVRN